MPASFDTFSKQYTRSADQSGPMVDHPHYILIFDPTIYHSTILLISSPVLIFFLIGMVVTGFASPNTRTRQTTASDLLIERKIR